MPPCSPWYTYSGCGPAPAKYPSPEIRLWSGVRLCDRGYCTEEERAAAAATPGIKVLSRPQFLELLKW